MKSLCGEISVIDKGLSVSMATDQGTDCAGDLKNKNAVTL